MQLPPCLAVPFRMNRSTVSQSISQSVGHQTSLLADKGKDGGHSLFTPSLVFSVLTEQTNQSQASIPLFPARINNINPRATMQQPSRPRSSRWRKEGMYREKGTRMQPEKDKKNPVSLSASRPVFPPPILPSFLPAWLSLFVCSLPHGVCVCVCVCVLSSSHTFVHSPPPSFVCVCLSSYSYGWLRASFAVD